MALNAVFAIAHATGTREVSLDRYLTPSAGETADREANQWIKSLRRAPVDGVPFRHRFTHRGDSLWSFAELYLHKRGTIAYSLRTASTLETLIDEHRPSALDLVRGD